MTQSLKERATPVASYSAHEKEQNDWIRESRDYRDTIVAVDPIWIYPLTADIVLSRSSEEVIYVRRHMISTRHCERNLHSTARIKSGVWLYFEKPESSIEYTSVVLEESTYYFQPEASAHLRLPFTAEQTQRLHRAIEPTRPIMGSFP